MSSEPAIRVRNLNKCFQIYDRPEDRLKQAVMPRIRRWTGRSEAASQSRYYREFWALRDVSFDVPRGSTLGVIGRNGSGKSTLLQIICGTLSPTSGAVEVNGRIAALLELGSGFNPEFTGRENVYLNASILGLSREQTDARFDDIAAFAEIGDFIEQPVKTYSSGMALRLAFAVIAHVDADVLVIDEALSVGDAFFTQKCMRFLRGFMRRGTLLFVSHDTSAVLALCDSAIWLDHGRKCLHGRAKLVSDRYLEALFAAQQGPGSIPPPADTGTGHGEATRASPDPATAPDPIGGGSNENHEVRSSRRPNQGIVVDDDRGHEQRLEFFEFNADGAQFGLKQATINAVELLDAAGRPVTHLDGSQVVSLVIRAHASQALSSPILGFYIRDRHGQTLFGDNTWLTTRDGPRAADAGHDIVAEFRFQMPILPVGDYSITVAIADGTQADHVQQHWLHDALIVRSHASSVSQGLVGIPMLSVSLQSIAPDDR